jgi:hypothetical protein
MKTPQNRRYFIYPSSQTNESITEILRQDSATVTQNDMLCSDGKRRNLIEVSYEDLILLRGERARGGGSYVAFRQIGEGRPKKFDDSSLSRAVAKSAATKSRARIGAGKAEVLAKLTAKPGICLGNKIAPSVR